MKKLILWILLGCMIFGRSYSQFYPNRASGDTANYPYWIEMMQDPDANFYATRHAFEKYWEGRTNYKGNGWKVFKRWEYIMQDQVGPDGKLPLPGSVLAEYEKWRSLHTPLSTGGNWTQVGPVALPANATSQPNGMGRINGLGFHPTDPNILYIGSPSGGLWRSTDGGLTWTVLTTTLPTLGVSSILVHPTTPSTIWIGTGDRDAADAPGMGVYKSTDGGSVWLVSNTGMGNATVGKMLMLPSDPNTILAATSSGIYKTTNGGASWVRKSSNTSNYKDILFKPGDPTIVYATAGGTFYRSTNTGESWSTVTIPVTGTRLVIGVSANQPTWVFLIQTNGPFAGCMKSTNDGQTFTTQSTTPNIIDYSCDGSGNASQAWYDLCIAVDPANANTLYVGGINIWKSTNGGTTWTINSHWVGSSWGVSCAPSVHADIHVLEWSPLNSKLFTGCDGGFYSTSNGGTNWTDLSSGLAIAQVYKIGQSATNPAIAMNGYQDNGTSSNSGTSFKTVIGGDGMECIVDYTDTNYRYGELYYGDILRSSGGGYGTIADNGVNGINESGAWITPYILHETIPSTMFIGYKNVWRSTNVKASSTSAVTWTKISTGETSNCAVLEQSPADVNVLYVTRGSVLKRTDNANDASPVWTTCNSPGGFTITDMDAHPTDPNIIYATASSRIYKSTDKGMTWNSITGTLPGGVTINCLVYDKNSNEGIYIGNKTNVFYKDATLPDWVAFSNGLPTVDVRELEIYYNASTPSASLIKAATYGRGQWQSDLYGVVPTLTVVPPNKNVPAAPPDTTIFSVTSNSNWSVVSSQSWCTVTPSGTGSGSLVATYTENLTVLQRIAFITVTVAGIPPVTVTVTQDAALPVLSVVPPNRNVPSSPPDTTSFTVTSNTTWNAVSDQPWCSVTPAGNGNGTIIAGYDENFSIFPRIANITVTVQGLSPIIVTVTQLGIPLTLSVQPPNQSVPETPGLTNFMITSNTSWTAFGDQPWCTVYPLFGTGNDTLYALYEQNFTYAPRIANITVSVTGIAPYVVTVTQDASTVGIPDNGTGSIRIYPNPTSGELTIRSGKGMGQRMSVAINNMQGEKVFENSCSDKDGCRFNLSSLPQGSYVLMVETGEEVIVRKLVLIK